MVNPDYKAHKRIAKLTQTKTQTHLHADMCALRILPAINAALSCSATARTKASGSLFRHA
jgi:hypothetical protein